MYGNPDNVLRADRPDGPDLTANERSITSISYLTYFHTTSPPQTAPSPNHENEKVPDGAFHQIMRASHVIKGAASNLMCQQLRQTAMALESQASTAYDAAGDPAAVQANLPIVKARFDELRQAVANYHAFLASVGI